MSEIGETCPRWKTDGKETFHFSAREEGKKVFLRSSNVLSEILNPPPLKKRKRRRRLSDKETDTYPFSDGSLRPQKARSSVCSTQIKMSFPRGWGESPFIICKRFLRLTLFGKSISERGGVKAESRKQQQKGHQIKIQGLGSKPLIWKGCKKAKKPRAAYYYNEPSESSSSWKISNRIRRRQHLKDSREQISRNCY